MPDQTPAVGMERKLAAFKDWLAVNEERTAEAGMPAGGMPISPAAGRAAGDVGMFPPENQSPFHGLDDATLTRVIDVCRGFRTFADIERKAGPLFMSDEELASRVDEKAVKKWLLKEPATGQPRGLDVVRDLRAALAAQQDWSPAALDELIRQFAEKRSLELGKVAQPLRVALTGGTISPAIGETLSLIGRERTLRRIEGMLSRVVG